MNRIFFLAVALVMSLSAAAQYVPTAENLAARKQFEGFRFGIFLHWGIYSEFAQGEWYLNTGNLNAEEYAKAASCFYPVRFDAHQWVKAIKASGARYITFTSRHHDGFSMWHTCQSDYNIVDATPFKRDVIAELSDACRSEGIRLHLYYSILDWIREDYPVGRTGLNTGRVLRPDYDSYFSFMKAQVRELLTQYDNVEGIWLDGYWDHDQDATPFDWRMPEFYRFIHQLKPACLVGNNHHIATIEGEDFQMFERDLPGENTTGYADAQTVSALPLEMCQTMNGMWGYKVADTDYKSSRELITLLEKAAAKGSNLLLNIGPQPNGELPAVALQRLADIGQWMDRYGASIYGTTRGTECPWGVTTCKPGTVYLHVLSPAQALTLPMDSKPRSVVRMGDNTNLDYQYDKRHQTLCVYGTNQYDVIEVKR